MASEVIKNTIDNLKISKSSFSAIFILWWLTPNRLNTFQECQHHEDTNFSKVIQGYIRQLLYQNYFNTSFMDRFG